LVVGDGPLAYRLTRALSTRFRGTVTVLLPDATTRYAHQMADLPAVEVRAAERVDEVAIAAAGAGRAASAALVEQDDGGNVALALLLREKWPELHVVVRIFDESLGRHLQRDRCTVLSSSAFAAPEIVAAALRRQIRLPVDHRRLVTVSDGEQPLPVRMVLFGTDADGEVVALPSDAEVPGRAPHASPPDAGPGDGPPEVTAAPGP